MSENKKTWDEKIKLILSELENRISAENAENSGSQKRRENRRLLSALMQHGGMIDSGKI